MLVVMKKSASEEELSQIKQFLVDHDFDFHQSTGANRIIIGVIGETRDFDAQKIKALPGVLEVFKIPEE
ncbi:hypothetical protein MJO47_12665 [Desulfuromonas sp. KJ2020]|uniref:hypothetical protein n=1 Tax=Desulfuromonas sp. KJ2020 TaxID=2919173 RepID=UPI00032624C1|nr:hypothetical protein [Desulfuromonas sp. KJ2020]MCP3177954.1 hypothetical protein [Desulfuromonas sp. KJ2020]